MTRTWKLQRQGYLVLMIVATVCVVSIASLAQTLSRELELLESANSDNVQWTLSQAEVEYLIFEGRLDNSLATHEDDPEHIRRAFDIFYSRIVTLETGLLYADLRGTTDFSHALAAIRRFLDDSVATIDTLETASRDDLIALEKKAEALASDVRRLANSGLYHFASQSDARRKSIAVSLQRLALVTTSLIAALALVAFYSHRVGQRAARGKRELQSAYARLNTIVNTSLDAVIVSDRFGRILDFNESAETIFGYRLEDVQGQKLSDTIVPDHLRTAHETGIARMNRTGETTVIGHGRVNLEAKRANGEIFPIEMALETAGQGDDQIVIGFLRDISNRVTARQELIEARDRALAGEKAKADFLAVMTHEIRTPLNGVIGNLSLLTDTKLTPKQQKYADNMGISARLLMQHVDTVLDIARFESGQFVMTDKLTHLGRLLQDIVDGQSGFAEANGNTLQWSWVGPQVDWVTTDASQVQQVLLNLVGNAIKFTANGRIAIEAERLPNGAGSDTAEIEFRVIDTGIGIAESDLDRVFEDFQTIDTSFQRQTNGTGLGLGIVRRLVQRMGGTVGVESSLGEGSVFWVRMPMHIADAPDPETARQNHRAAIRPLHILVVEDNEINLFLVREMLERLGHRVDTATDGLAGVSAANAQRYDLILMDISMPVLNGLDACRRIRGDDGASKSSPIVALSANVLPDMRDRIVEAGMSGFLGKPLEQEDLLELLSGIDPSQPVAPPETPRQDGPQEDVLTALRQRFQAETDDLMGWLSTTPADRGEIAARCHKVAGSAAVFDRLDLRDALLQVEKAAETDASDSDLRDRIAAAQAVWAA